MNTKEHELKTNAELVEQVERIIQQVNRMIELHEREANDKKAKGEALLRGREALRTQG